MTAPTPSRPLADRLDRTGGRVLYRTVGVLAALPAVGALGSGIWALSAGQWVGAVLLLAFAAGMAALARWCFSANRRLSDAEWWA